MNKKQFIRTRKYWLTAFLGFVFWFSQSQVTTAWISAYNSAIPSYTSGSIGSCIAVDNSKKIVVAGLRSFTHGYGDSSSVFIIRYSNNGSVIWTSDFNSPLDTAETVNDMIIDNKNNIFIAGNTLNNVGETQILFLKVDSNGVVKWFNLMPTHGGYDDDGKLVRLDVNNKPILCSVVRLANNNLKFLITKFSQTGQILRRKMIDSASTISYKFSDFEIDKNGNLYLGSTLSSKFSITKLDSSFNTINTTTLNIVNTVGLNAIDVDTSQNIYLTGDAVNASYDYCVVKCRPSGSIAWFKYYNGPGNSSDSPADIKVNSKGDIFITGFDRGISTNEDVCTIKYDSTGNLIWINRFDTTGNDDFGHKLLFDKLENVYVKGRMHVLNESYATIRYTSTGSRLWSKTYNPYYSNDWAFDFCVDDSLSIFVTGYTAGSGYAPGDIGRCTTIKYRQSYSIDGIKEHFENLNFAVFPNPTSDGLTIKNFNLSETFSLKITNILGQEYFSQKDINEKELQLSLKEIPPQLLFLLIDQKDSYKTFKLIKQ